MEQTPENRMGPNGSSQGGSGDGAGNGQKANEPPKENIKETIESILVAFILAFVFRAFVVEAFVIPSGSMAPTLLGAHMRFQCEDCGYRFKVNYPAQDYDSDNIRIPSVTPMVFSVHCPNCGMKVGREGQNQLIPVYYGDRILVLKYLYLLKNPDRWDVVVFKSPAESNRYSQNFIKRLVAQPGETVMVLDGDVYVCPNEKAQPVERDEQDLLPIDNWPWQVQAKPRKVQDALWRVVCDQDFLPLNQPWRQASWAMPWQSSAGSGWATAGHGRGGRLLTFDNLADSGTLTLNRTANEGTFPLTDWLPYNETKDVNPADPAMYRRDAYGSERIPRWYVSDLKVQFAYRRDGGDGAMRAALTKLGHTFTAELLPDKARLVHRLADGSEKVVGEAKLDTSGELNVELMNVDYQVTLRINGRDLIQTTPEEYRPDVKQLLALHRERERMLNTANYEKVRSVFPAPKVELSAERQKCQVSHLSLWRDVYYTPNYYSGGRFTALSHGSPERPVRLSRHGQSTVNERGETIDGKYVDNEYFVLGDNSILSGDARNWVEPVDLREGERLYTESGRVPERFMLGKAFFVYWPAGYRPFSQTMPGIVPDFGDMRFID
ncbi:MAG TPA: S26 family signal peptidase [Tepidisphaeraceae bacterium]|nr:S26 family signal peptidase [Tepidisphaeraceae bacterium]